MVVDAVADLRQRQRQYCLHAMELVLMRRTFVQGAQSAEGSPRRNGE